MVVKLDCLKLLVITLCFFSLAGNIAFGQMTEPLYEFGSHEYLKSLGEYRESLVRDAEDDIIRSLKEYPDNPTMDMAEILRARIDNINGNYNIADGRLKEFLINRPNSPFIAQAAALRGFLAFENKNYDKAQKLLLEASDQAKKASRFRQDKKYDELAHTCLFWRGIAFAHKGKYQEAMPIFEECYQSYPELSEAIERAPELSQSHLRSYPELCSLSFCFLIIRLNCDMLGRTSVQLMARICKKVSVR